MANEPPTESSGVPADIPAAVAGSDGHKDDQTRERAYLVWVDEGRPQGRELDHWLRAKWSLSTSPVDRVNARESLRHSA